MGLRKRLKKKKSLLEVLFPKLNVKALVILSKEATGVNVFPSYCTLWITDILEVNSILERLKNFDKKSLKPFVKVDHPKMQEVYSIETSNFKYFATLNWVLRQVKADQKQVLDIGFLKSPSVEKYYDIYTKIFVGFTSYQEFKKLYGQYQDSTLKEILGSKIEDSKIYIAIEKTHKGNFTIVYFAKIEGGKLKRIEISKEKVSIVNKDSKGFTFSEIKYLKFIFKPNHKLSGNDIKSVQDLI